MDLLWSKSLETSGNIGNNFHMVQERRAARRFILNSSDTAANRARTRHIQRKHAHGTFVADYEILHNRARNCRARQQLRNRYDHIIAASPGGLRRSWVNGSAKGTVKQHRQGAREKHGELGREFEVGDMPDEVDARLNFMPLKDPTAVGGCEVGYQQLASRLEGAEVAGEIIGSQTHCIGMGHETKPCTVLRGQGGSADKGKTSSSASVSEAHFKYHVSCDDLVPPAMLGI
jgi:hypothetical protein